MKRLLRRLIERILWKQPQDLCRICVADLYNAMNHRGNCPGTWLT